MVISLYEGGKMNSVENYAIRYLEPKDVKDLDQYNALLRYTFQVTEDELTATGWNNGWSWIALPSIIFGWNAWIPRR